MSDCLLNRVFVGKYSTKTVQYIWPDNIITVILNKSRDSANVEQFSDSDNEGSIQGSSGFISNEELISRWNLFLTNWKSNAQTRPKELLQLVKSGIPDSLRGEVWPLLTSSVNKEPVFQDAYKVLITKETKFDSIIKRDMSRIFTAHPKFVQNNVTDQEVLFQVCKAYVLYDEEIGYCQIVASLAASLLIHMPEEQSFGLLVTIMHDYKVREMYRNNFEGLHICLYQLDNLMGELNDLYMHFSELQLESHLYANQWFMTLFTTKFHLCSVFHILDLFFTEVALALLKLSRKELLTMDFQGTLNHFRVALPKLYCTEESCKDLISVALKIKISNSKLLRLENEWRKIQEVKAENEDPLAMLQTELKRTKEEYNRLDQESDCLAKELLSTKVCLQRIVEKLDDNLDVTNKELFTTRKEFVDILDEKEHLQAELKEVKDKFREEVQMCEGKLRENDSTVVEYENLVAQLSKRIEKAEYRTIEESDSRVPEYLESIISKCEHCKKRLIDKELLLDGYNHIRKIDDILCLTRGHYYHQRDQINHTELTLANTKLSLVESQCVQQTLYNEVTYLKNLVNQQTQSLDSSKVSIIHKLWNIGTKTTEDKPELVVKWSQDSSTSLSHFVHDA